MNDGDLLASRIGDLITKCERTATACFSDFLDGSERADVVELIDANSSLFFGGAEDTERSMLGIFPDWEEPVPEAFPISCVRIEHRFGEPMSHRQYLGSILGLGIDRAKVGDIFISDNVACVFASDNIASFIANNLERVGRTAVKAKVVPISEAVIPVREFRDINTVSASERADAVIAAILNISRRISSELIKAERVEINHRLFTDGSKPLVEGDLISVRGHGRFILDAYGNKTRRDRLHISARKYL